MISRSNILLVTKDEAAANEISSVLSSSQDMILSGVCRELSEVGSYLEQASVAAVVVDIDADPLRLLSDLSVIIAVHSGPRFVVISSVFKNSFILGAMQAGARHFLLKESIASELTDVLHLLVSDMMKKEVALGSVISVLSASGGCGATMVTVNLANELRLASSGTVLTVDLDEYYGTVSAYLGISGQYGLADVLGHKGPIDRHLIRSSAYNYMEDFHVLVSPASIKYPTPKLLQWENLVDVLQACRQAYKYTVVDAPRVSERIAVDLAAVSKAVLLVFQLTVKDIKVAQSMLSSLTSCGVSSRKIIPVANRFKKRGPLVRIEDGQKALGVDTIPCIRSDFRRAVSSLNHGKTLAQVAPWSGVRHDYQRLAAYIETYRTNGNGKTGG
jgi:Flp pilus assembly CpaE family ATPase